MYVKEEEEEEEEEERNIMRKDLKFNILNSTVWLFACRTRRVRR